MYEPEERPRNLSRFLVPLGAAVVAVLLVVAAVFAYGAIGGDDDDDGATAAASPTPGTEATPPPSDPIEAALGDYVSQTLGAQYSGDCANASPNQPPASTGSAGGPAGTGADAPPANGAAGAGLCSQARGEREGVRAFVLGEPLSEPSRWAFLQETGGGWQVVHSPEITPETSAVPGTPWPLAPGAEVIVVGTAPDCLNVREGPSLDQAGVDCIPDGTVVTVSTGPAESDGLLWWQVEGRAGWVASDFLRYQDAAQ